MNKFVFGFALLLLHASAIDAAPAITAKVLYSGLYGDGRAFIAFDTEINETGCVKSRIDMPPDHAQRDHFLEIARSAATSGRSVVVSTNGCFAGYPTFDNTTGTYMYLRSGTNIANSSWTSTGQVQRVISHDGRIVIQTTINVDACGTLGKFWWDSGDEDAKDMLSIALTAFATGRPIAVAQDSTTSHCFANAQVVTHLLISQ